MVTRRLERLRGGQKYFSILALDHGLTIGHGEGVPTYPFTDVMNACANQVMGVVFNYGMARSYSELPNNMSLVLQCFGAPLRQRRVQITTVHHAIKMDAAAVAVQINLADPDLPSQTREISSFTVEAHSVGMPVLYMVSGIHQGDAAEVARSIRICHEMGADIIKVTCSPTVLLPPNSELSQELLYSPPVLIAGGPLTEDLRNLATNAKRVGFSGYCVGRHIFQSSQPRNVVAMLHEIFNTNQLEIGDI